LRGGEEGIPTNPQAATVQLITSGLAAGRDGAEKDRGPAQPGGTEPDKKPTVPFVVILPPLTTR